MIRSPARRRWTATCRKLLPVTPNIRRPKRNERNWANEPSRVEACGPRSGVGNRNGRAGVRSFVPRRLGGSAAQGQAGARRGGQAGRQQGRQEGEGEELRLQQPPAQRSAAHA